MVATIRGLDYSWGRPRPSYLASAGFRFVCRYLSYDRSGKNLTAAEASSLRGHGINVVLNWEAGKYDVLGGHATGVKQARDAQAQAHALGAPADIPIYFSCDLDARGNDLAAVTQYMAGAQSVIGKARMGMYGGIDQLDHVYKAGAISWLWQTYAWSGGRVHPRAHIYQYQNGVRTDGADTDLDRALQSDYGAWLSGIAGVAGAIAGAIEPQADSSWDYTPDIAGTADQLLNLTTSLTGTTMAISALRNL